MKTEEGEKKRLLAIILDAAVSIYANDEYKIGSRNNEIVMVKILLSRQTFTNLSCSLLYVINLYIIW